MRPYRGKTKEGKWVYGWYLETHNPTTSNTSWIIKDGLYVTDILIGLNDTKFPKMLQGCYKVIPESVGQFVTKDKNGKDVYEGAEIKALTYWRGNCKEPQAITGKVGWRDETLSWVLCHTPNTPECIELWKLHDIELMEQDND